MTKLFVPFAESPEQATGVLSSIKKHLSLPESTEAFQALSWTHNGQRYEAIVGSATDFNGEVVIAILFDPHRKCWHVCTPNRGVATGGSILAGDHSVSRSVRFSAP